MSLCRLVTILVLSGLSAAASAQSWSEEDRKRDLARIADVERKLRVEMRDGTGLSTDVYLPKNAHGPLPTIFWRTPYDYNDMRGTRLRFVHEAVRRGYAFVIQNERGQFFSEGEWEILGRPRTDGYDALDWIAEQDWSNGKVGTIGCSSSAEWQLALAQMDHPAHAAMVPMASGAGIGRVGGWYEQGNWYEGGVFQMLFASWLHGVQNGQRPRLPKDLSQEDRVRLSKYYDLTAERQEIDWGEALKTLPLVDILKHQHARTGPYEAMIRRSPDDPAWYEGGLAHDNAGWGVPALWCNSWYDVSMGPNLALANHAKAQGADAEVRDNQYILVAPTLHCGFYRIPDGDLVVGERNIGKVALDPETWIYDWFDFWLKGEDTGFKDTYAPVTYFAFGANDWREAEAWPPKAAEPIPLYLTSGEGANSLFGDGQLRWDKPDEQGTDRFTYDPMNPVPATGGGVCCIGGAAPGGAFDQRGVEARADVLVYTSDPLQEDIEIAGWVPVTLYVSSDAKDTDFTVKLVDVAPNGTAYNLDNSIQRARWREGYDQAVFMQEGEVYELKIGPLVTANRFKAGHRIRLEVSSSNFPQFARNLNTGGDPATETMPIVAKNAVHHGGATASHLELPVVARGQAEPPTPDRAKRAQADSASIDAIVTALYDVISGPAGQPRDWDRFRSLFAPSARLMAISEAAEGGLVVMSPEDYVRQSGPRLVEAGFRETEIAREVDRFGGIVQIFSTYAGFTEDSGDNPAVRGINSIQLYHDGTRWWLLSVLWQAEGAGLALPSNYLPAGTAP